MMTLPAMLLPGFLLGLLHALDVDHVAAVSALAARQTGWRTCTGYALRWASGHAVVLLGVALLVTAQGVQLPEAAGLWAEKAVGVILLVTGASLVLAGRKLPWPQWSSQRLVLASPGAPVAPQHRHARAPFLVGMVHGLAGSAGALALVPTALHQPGAAMLYVAFFSLGVGAAMFAVAALLGQTQQALAQRHRRLIDTYRQVLALAAMLLGVHWLGGF